MKKIILKSACITLAAILATAGVCTMASVLNNNTVAMTESEEVGDIILQTNSSNRLRLMAASSIAESDDTASKTITACMDGLADKYQQFSWTVGWQDTSETTDFSAANITITPSEDTKSCVVTCGGAFDKVVLITVKSECFADVTATCTVNYTKRVTSAVLNVDESLTILGGAKNEYPTFSTGDIALDLSAGGSTAITLPNITIPSDTSGTFYFGGEDEKCVDLSHTMGVGTIDPTLDSAKIYVKLSDSYINVYTTLNPPDSEDEEYGEASLADGYCVFDSTTDGSGYTFYPMLIKALGAGSATKIQYSQYNYVLNCLQKTTGSPFSIIGKFTFSDGREYNFVKEITVNSGYSYVEVNYAVTLSEDSISF